MKNEFWAQVKEIILTKDTFQVKFLFGKDSPNFYPGKYRFVISGLNYPDSKSKRKASALTASTEKPHVNAKGGDNL